MGIDLLWSKRKKTVRILFYLVGNNFNACYSHVYLQIYHIKKIINARKYILKINKFTYVLICQYYLKYMFIKFVLK